MRHIEIQFRPMESYPVVRSKHQRRSPFKANYRHTLMLLDDELRAIDARQCVLSLDIDPNHWRRDGQPREDKPAKSPAVVLSFETKKAGPLQYPCDSFIDWRDNVRAIALSLEALRKMDRYGVTKNAEQYKGWARLGGPAPTSDSYTPETAADYLGKLTGIPPADLLRSRDAFVDALKQAKILTHPDRVGVDQAFKEVQKAGEVLGRRHGV